MKKMIHENELVLEYELRIVGAIRNVPSFYFTALIDYHGRSMRAEFGADHSHDRGVFRQWKGHGVIDIVEIHENLDSGVNVTQLAFTDTDKHLTIGVNNSVCRVYSNTEGAFEISEGHYERDMTEGQIEKIQGAKKHI